MSERCERHNNLIWPADRPFPAGESDYCHACWKQAGGGNVRPAALTRLLPCVHEGPILEHARCGDPLKHVRDCERHDRCTRGASRVRSCATCPDYSTGRPEVAVTTSGKGIGDMISQLYACVGLADAGYAVTMRCWHDLGWLSGVSHPGLTLTGGGDGHDCNRDYRGQQARAAANQGTRVGWYCDNLTKAAGVPSFTPARPSVTKPAPVREPGYAVLSPFSDDAARCWPVERWRQLAAGLLAAGWDVAAVDKPDAGPRLKAALGGIQAVELRVGEHPAKAAAVIANAGLFVGNDSGMSHLAGLYGVPGAVVMTHFPFRFVFAEAPSLTGFGKHRGRMADVTAAEVLAWAGQFTPTKSPPDVFGLIRRHLGQRAATTEWLFREMATRWQSPRVVETGCVRSPEDWSAGYFGWLCGALLESHGGGLVTVDNDPDHCRTARGLCHRWGRAVVVEADSVRYLTARTEPVDLAYLDSHDADLPGHAEHGLREAQAVEPLMSERGLIVFDDTPRSGDGWTGKGGLAVPWLVSQGWKVRPESGYQCVMEK